MLRFLDEETPAAREYLALVKKRAGVVEKLNQLRAMHKPKRATLDAQMQLQQELQKINGDIAIVQRRIS